MIPPVVGGEIILQMESAGESGTILMELLFHLLHLAGGDTEFYRTRDYMVIRLNRVDGNFAALSRTGVYRCEIPGVGGVTITRYITLSDTIGMSL